MDAAETVEQVPLPPIQLSAGVARRHHEGAGDIPRTPVDRRVDRGRATKGVDPSEAIERPSAGPVFADIDGSGDIPIRPIGPATRVQRKPAEWMKPTPSIE